MNKSRFFGIAAISWFMVLSIISCAPEPGREQGKSEEGKISGADDAIVKADPAPTSPVGIIELPPVAAVPAAPLAPIPVAPVGPPPVGGAFFAPPVADFGGDFGHHRGHDEDNCIDTRDCFDDNPCTVDICQKGECVNVEQPECIACDTDAECPSTETCIDDVCRPRTVTVGGTIVGLNTVGLVLQNGTATLPIGSTDTSFVFPPVHNGSAYNVTVLTQPAGLVCSVINGSGTANADVTDVVINCLVAPTTFTIGGTISGLNEAGLQLQNNGGNTLVVPINATTFTFTLPVASGAAYNVTVFQQPDNDLICNVTANGSGLATSNVTNVTVQCLLP